MFFYNYDISDSINSMHAFSIKNWPRYLNNHKFNFYKMLLIKFQSDCFLEFMDII